MDSVATCAQRLTLRDYSERTTLVKIKGMILEPALDLQAYRWILPRAVKFRDDPTLLPPDIEIDKRSRSYARTRELTYYEAVGADGHVVYTSAPIVGEQRIIRQAGREFLNFYKALRTLPPSVFKSIVLIRSAHTHRDRFESQFFSASDILILLAFHAFLEFEGLASWSLEQAILFRQWPRYRTLEKRTVTIAGNSLSYARGDYSLGLKNDRLFKEMIKNR